MTDLKKLRELAGKATKGKWKIFGSDSHVMGISIEESIALGIPHAQWTHNMSPENAAFSVAANPETVIALIDRIERLEKVFNFVKDAQCECSICERESGHLVGCWKPEFEELTKEVNHE